ncbi:MAG: PAS domain-containing protein, partial [Planctomycetota bacterium]
MARQDVSRDPLLGRLANPAIVVDADGVLTAVNAAAERLFRAPASEMVGRTLSDLCEGCDPGRIRGLVADGGDDRELPGVRLKTADGGTTVRDLRFLPLQPDGGGAGACLVMPRQAPGAGREAAGKRELLAALLFKTTQDGVMLADATTRKFVYANPAVARMLGYGEEELVGMGVEDIHPAQDLPRVVEAFEAQARGDIHMARDIPCLCRNGAIINADISSTSVTIEGKKFLAGIFRDTTERKRAEEALRESEEKYRTFVDNASMIIVRTNREGKLLLVNKYFCDATGLSPEDVIDRGPEVFKPNFDKENYQKAVEAIQKSIRRETEVEVVLQSTDPFGNDAWDLQTSYPWYDANGDLGGAEIVIQDITPLRRTEEALRDSEERFRSLAESAPGIIVVADRAGKIQFINRTVEGFTPDETVGTSIFDYLLPEFHETAKRTIE